ncbi:hypothetical protein J3F84DRAFT_262167 [Trichoderma pleuroticola]
MCEYGHQWDSNIIAGVDGAQACKLCLTISHFVVYLSVKFTFGKSWELLGEPGISIFILFFFFFLFFPFFLFLSFFALHYMGRSERSSTDAIGGQYRRRTFLAEDHG